VTDHLHLDIKVELIVDEIDEVVLVIATVATAGIN